MEQYVIEYIDIQINLGIHGFAGPRGERVLTGITFDPITNDILVIGTTTDKVYRYSNGSWDSGIAIYQLQKIFL